MDGYEKYRKQGDWKRLSLKAAIAQTARGGGGTNKGHGLKKKIGRIVYARRRLETKQSAEDFIRVSL